MSINVNEEGCNNSEAMSSGIKRDMCDKIGCMNKASVKPVIQLRSSPVAAARESFFPIKVCSEHATVEEGKELISGAKQKAMLQDIFKVQTKGGQVDWSCSGVVWAQLQ